MSELGELCVWSSDTKLTDLIPGRRNQVKNYGDGDDRGDISEDDDENEEDEDADETSAKKAKKNKIEKDESGSNLVNAVWHFHFFFFKYKKNLSEITFVSDETKKEVEKTKQVFYTRTAKYELVANCFFFYYYENY